MNKCSFIGRMGANTRFFPANGSKKAFITFSMAIKRPGGQKDQQGNILTDWLEFNAFGKTAELINQYIPKGTLMCVDDCIAVVEKFNDKNTGQERHAVKFNVRAIDLEVSFASNKGNGQKANGGNNGYANNDSATFNNRGNSRTSYAPPAPEYSEPSSISDGELPF